MNKLFILKKDRKFRIKKGSNKLLSNQSMTKKLALDFLKVNTEFRKTLFEKLPSNIDEMLTPKNKD